MKKVFLVTLVLAQMMILNTAFAYEENETDTPETHEVYVSYRFATAFCHVTGLEAAKERAYAYCAENGFRQDECNLTSVRQYSSSDIYESSGQEYSNRRHGMIYYIKLCTYQAKFQMIHKTIGKYDVIFPDGYFSLWGNLEGIVARFNLNTQGLANFYVKEVSDAAHYSSHLEFHMTVSRYAIGTTLDLGTICIRQDEARYLPENAPFTNDNFSLVITHAEKPKWFDGCARDEVPASAKLKIIK